MFILKRLWCILTQGHQFTPSYVRPGMETCVRCRVRR